MAEKLLVAFLCHASEDKAYARTVAERFRATGIETFFDEWEVGPGDSLRQKIDHGLDACTHFVVLLTPASIGKPWVNAEIDAGFVKKLEGSCKFFPIRSNLRVEQLPPLLRGLHSPEITDFERDVSAIVDSIHGISNKPPLGEPPKALASFAANGPTGLSKAAEAIVRVMIEQSDDGYSGHVQLTPDDIRQTTSLSDDAIVDAVDELEGYGLIKKLVFLGSGAIGFGRLMPEARLFSQMDKFFKPWNPEEDAKQIAADLVNGADGNVQALAEKYAWTPRRINPAITYLLGHGLIDASRSLGCHPWCTSWIAKKHETRRWVQSWS